MSLVSLFFSGILLSLAFSPFPAHFLAYIALIPLLYFSARNPFLSGFIFGLGHFASLLFWILFLVVPPPIKRWVIVGVIVLILYLAIYYGLLSLAIRYLGVISLPFAIVILEFIRSQGDLAFPWGVIGYTQASYLPILQWASIFGIYGLSFFVGVVNLIIYLAIKKRRYFLIPIPLILIALGSLMMRPTRFSSYRVGVLQPNINTNIVWNQGLRDRTFARLIDQTDSLAKEGAGLIIWPESSMPTIITGHRSYSNQLKSLADSNQVSILVGTAVVERRKGFRLYNGAILIRPGIGITGIYKKMHLVPFSEHLPYEQRFRFLKNFNFGQGNYWPGTEFTVFDVGKRFGCLICFESIFPELSRGFVERGVDFLVNITNDGWFGKSPGPYQHAEMAVVRAVEFRTPIVRCANTGVSMLIDPYGRTIDRTRIFEEARFVVRLPEPGRSLYLGLGDLIVYLSFLIIGFLIIRVGRPSLLPFSRR